MRAKNALVGFGILFLSAFAFAQGGEDPIDRLTQPQTQNTGLRQRFALPCPFEGEGGYRFFADFFTNCVYDGGSGGILGKGFRDGDGGFPWLGGLGISYSGLTYVPSSQDRFEGKIVFRDHNLALEEMERVLENSSLVAVLSALWSRDLTITDLITDLPSSLSPVLLTVYVPEPLPSPSSGEMGRTDGGNERERAASLVRAVCSLSEKIAPILRLVGARPVRVKFYRKSAGIEFVGDALFMARVDALNRESGAKRIHLIGLRNSRGWKGAYGEPSTGMLVSGFWSTFDRLSKVASCER